MFIAIEHEIHDSAKFQDCVAQAATPPEGVRAHQFLPARDLSRAVCIYEGPSVSAVSAYVESVLRDSSTQSYFVIAEEQAVGLPAGQRA